MENVLFSAATADPPFLPAAAARDLFWENERFSGGIEDPPLLAILRCFSGDILANPRFAFGFSSDIEHTPE
ncbi:MAG: hypothetical protein Q8M07_10320 [Prosthecobacter sp.]|nr:hypothetical protein [Prosthecobacter sp.]